MLQHILRMFKLLILYCGISIVVVCAVEKQNCPTWTVPKMSSNTTQQGCKCGSSVGQVVYCNETNLKVSLLMGYCMTYNDETEMAYVADCPLKLHHNYNLYTPLPSNVSELNNFVCSAYNRQGMVCSECKPRHGPSVYTHNLNCYKCSGLYHGWLLYIVFELFPITVLFSIMSLLHIRLTSSGANCLLFNVQMMVAILSYGAHVGIFPFGSTSTILYKILLTVYGITTLDFFREIIPPFCVSQHINGLHTIALQYLAVVYLLALTLSVFLVLEMHYRGNRITMWVWKNIFVRLIRVKQNWTFRTSLADSLATFLLLSYTRLMLVSFNLLYPVPIFNETGAIAKTTLNFQQNIEFLSVEHLPFALLGLTVLITLVLLPIMLFIVYPMKCCQKSCSQYLGNKAGLRHFVELFQGCFKDGTDNTHDFRWFAIFYFVLRFLMFVTHIIGYGAKPKTSFLLPGVMLIGALLIILILRPYKRNIYNNTDGVMLAIAALMCFFQSVMVIIPTTIVGKLLQITIQIGLFLPLLFIPFYCVYLCIVTYRQSKQSRHESSTSCESLPHRMLYPDHESYSENQSLITKSLDDTQTTQKPKYGSMNYTE